MISVVFSLQDLENTISALLALRLAAEAAASQRQTVAVSRLLKAVIQQAIPDGFATQSFYNVFQGARLIMSCVPKETNIFGQANKTLKTWVAGCPDGRALVVNANRCSRSSHEEFDVVVFLGSVVLLCDCASARSAPVRPPTAKIKPLVAKAEKIRTMLQEADILATHICVVIVSSSPQTTASVEVEASSNILVAMLGLEQLRALMPPWSDWVFRLKSTPASDVLGSSEAVSES